MSQSLIGTLGRVDVRAEEILADTSRYARDVSHVFDQFSNPRSPSRRPWVPIGAASGARGSPLLARPPVGHSETRQGPRSLSGSGSHGQSTQKDVTWKPDDAPKDITWKPDDHLRIAEDALRAAAWSQDLGHNRSERADEATLTSLQHAGALLESYREQLLSNHEGKLVDRSTELLSKTAGRFDALSSPTGRARSSDKKGASRGLAHARLAAFAQSLSEASPEAESTCTNRPTDDAPKALAADHHRVAWLSSSVRGWQPPSTASKTLEITAAAAGNAPGRSAPVAAANVHSPRELLKSERNAGSFHSRSIARGSLSDPFAVTHLLGYSAPHLVENLMQKAHAAYQESAGDDGDEWWLATRGAEGVTHGHRFFEFGLSGSGRLDAEPKPEWMPVGAASGANAPRPRTAPPRRRSCPSGWKGRRKNTNIVGDDSLGGFATGWLANQGSPPVGPPGPPAPPAPSAPLPPSAPLSPSAPRPPKLSGRHIDSATVFGPP